MKLVFLVLFFNLLTTLCAPLWAQQLTVAHYNVENLFDTINDPAIDDEEFLPEAEKKWNSERYAKKLDQLAEVIASMNAGKGPDFLGLCEVENVGVVADLAAQKRLKKQKYQYVHHDSPDGRGIDVAFMYRKGQLKNVSSRSAFIADPENPNFRTRDILVVNGTLKNGQQAYFLVNHWPSRVGGQEKSQPKRILAARLARTIYDSIKVVHPKASVFILGDLNDEATDVSVYEVLRTDSSQNGNSDLYNPFYQLARKGDGSIVYQKKYQLIDHIIVSSTTLGDQAKVRYVAGSAGVYKPEFIRETNEKYKGNPWRTYAGKNYLGGYSDHFPVYLQIELRKK